MELRFLRVSSLKSGKTSRRPKMAFKGDWIAAAGFEVGSRVMAEFSMGEVVFRPRDEGDNGAFTCGTTADGRKLLQIKASTPTHRCRPALYMSGAWLARFGFSIGTHIVVTAEQGLIRAKVNTKADRADVSVWKMTYARLSAALRKPKMVFYGNWLSDAGFETDSLAIAEFAMGEIVFRLCDEGGCSTYGLISEAKKNGHRVLRVGVRTEKGKRRPTIATNDPRLPDLGFETGVRFSVSAEYGILRAKLIDESVFGL